MTTNISSVNAKPVQQPDQPQGRIIRMHGRLRAHAEILREEQVTIPAHLISLDGESECTVTALGNQHAFGTWHRLPEHKQWLRHQRGEVEGKLLLGFADWTLVDSDQQPQSS